MSGLRMGSGFAIRSGINFCKLSISLVAAFLISSFILPAPAVNAASESYTWVPGNGQQIKATGGVFGSDSATIEKASDGTWRIKSDTRLSLRSGPCSVGPRTGVFLRFDVDLSSSKLNIHNPPFDGDATAVAGCSQAAGSNSFDYGEKVSIKGTAPKPDQPTTTNDACSYFSDNKAQQACRNGAAAYARDGVVEANKVCDNGGSEMNTQTLKDACKEGVRTANLESLFGPVVNVVCSESDPAVHNTCVKKFNATLISCMNGNKADLAATKTCMIGKYPTAKAEIEKISNTPVSDVDETEQKSTCVVEGIGWIICPVVSFMAKITDQAYNIVSALLQVRAFTDSEGSKSLQAAWASFRNIANICFVFAFLIIIYSQLTGAGISNYGLKRLLPKLIIAAVLVNMSYVICALAVDLSNFIGASIKDFFAGDGVLKVTSRKDASGGLDTGGGFAGIAGGVLAGVAGLAFVYITLAALLPVLISAMVAIIGVFLVLMMRQALIILLIVVSPLAFVAYLLPNTEPWFTKWRKLFWTLLLMYPVIGLVFGASSLASTIVMNSASGSGVNTGIRIAIQIMGAGISIVPLFITPLIMKTSGALLGRFGGMINNPNKGPFDRLRKRAEKRGGDIEARRAAAALSGGRRIRSRVFGGKYRSEAKRDARTESLKRLQADAARSYVAGEAMTTDENGNSVATKFGRQLAGANMLGRGADQTSIQSALANARFTIDEAIAKEIKAESVMVRDMGKDELKSALAAGGSSEARQAAMIQRLIKVGDAGDYENEANSAINSDSSTVRRATAEALASDGAQFLKASDIDAIASGQLRKKNKAASPGDEVTLRTIARDNVNSGTVSAEKIVNETSGNIKFAFDAADDVGKQRLVDAASEAQSNEQLRGKIKHNIAAIGALTDATKHVTRAPVEVRTLPGGGTATNSYTLKID